MKVFWSIVIAVIAAGVVAFLWPSGASRTSVPTIANDAPAPTTTDGPRPTTPTAPPAPTPAAVTPTASDAPPAPAARTDASNAAAALAKDLQTERATAVERAATPTPPPVAPAAAPKETPAAPTSEFRDGLDHPIKNATVKPGRIERGADGTLVADGRFTVRGLGTRESPYVIPWDLLTSAMDTFAPRQGMNDIPQRIAMLDGKHVRIEGYLAIPLVSAETKQCLVTLNQWDGCCIGVPPTAYDAIEVTLDAPVGIRRTQHQFMYGAVEGVFRVEPYVMDQWLVGLYLLDDAKLKLDL
ncbi:MAG: hypothetical protein U0572_09750 [Phycisphaerales bacterium]